MFGLELIVALVSTVIVGTVIGRRYRVGPPVLLILLGVLLGLVPDFAHIRVDGQIVLLLFRPAILYWEGLNTSFREIRANARIIVFLSVVLVSATAVAVSWTVAAGPDCRPCWAPRTEPMAPQYLSVPAWATMPPRRWGSAPTRAT